MWRQEQGGETGFRDKERFGWQAMYAHLYEPEKDFRFRNYDFFEGSLFVWRFQKSPAEINVGLPTAVLCTMLFNIIQVN